MMMFQKAISVLLVMCVWHTTLAQSEIPQCSQPMEPGPCRGFFTRYFYDSTSGQCEQFGYGGCEGNNNNFLTIDECDAACVVPQCSQPMVTGPCRGAMPRFYYDSTSGQCQPFTYGGCLGNDNNFITSDECVAACVPQCSQPMVTGPCRGAMPRFHYDSTSGQCQPFTYGGCLGNDNNFITSDECVAACVPQCSQPMVTGPCRGAMPRFYYDSTSGQCQPFTYGGCLANDNNFIKSDECVAACVPQCSQPMVTGPCRGAMPRFYYDSTSGQCQPFTYGGCLGNDNNFITSDECVAVCVPQCSQPMVTGPCRGAMPRFYYDSTSGQCQPFTYGGCLGNDNNFITSDECVAACVPVCGGVEYNATTDTCCIDKINQGAVRKNRTDCCQTIAYDKEEKQCCDGHISSLSRDCSNI